MNKTLQDLAWRCLPREFREEVKKVADGYRGRASIRLGEERYLANKFLDDFINLFGRHNLTSNANGEDEMLCVSRKRVQEIYKQANSLETCNAIDALFGSLTVPVCSGLSILKKSAMKPSASSLS